MKIQMGFFNLTSNRTNEVASFMKFKQVNLFDTEKPSNKYT